jgi:hypothetical protein
MKQFSFMSGMLSMGAKEGHMNDFFHQLEGL